VGGSATDSHPTITASNTGAEGPDRRRCGGGPLLSASLPRHGVCILVAMPMHHTCAAHVEGIRGTHACLRPRVTGFLAARRTTNPERPQEGSSSERIDRFAVDWLRREEPYRGPAGWSV
jgi:hypothetical protein